MFGFGRQRQQPAQAGEKPYRDWHDIASLVVNGLGFLAVIATIIITLRTNASNDADMANALGDMRNIAVAMNEEAGAIAAQRPFVERQANAAADSASAAKDSAGAAKGQTAAIVQQANSLIEGARATINAAGAQLASAQAINRSAEAGAKAAEEQTRAAALLSVGQRPILTLSNVRIVGLDSPPDKQGRVNFTVQPAFSNDGGSVLYPSVAMFKISFVTQVPDKMIKGAVISFGGNALSVAPHSGFSVTEPFSMWIPAAEQQILKSGKEIIFVWGTAEFDDGQGVHHKTCYSGVVNMRDLKPETASLQPAGSPEFRCPST